MLEQVGIAIRFAGEVEIPEPPTMVLSSMLSQLTGGSIDLPSDSIPNLEASADDQSLDLHP